MYSKTEEFRCRVKEGLKRIGPLGQTTSPQAGWGVCYMLRVTPLLFRALMLALLSLYSVCRR